MSISIIDPSYNPDDKCFNLLCDGRFEVVKMDYKTFLNFKEPFLCKNIDHVVCNVCGDVALPLDSYKEIQRLVEQAEKL